MRNPTRFRPIALLILLALLPLAVPSPAAAARPPCLGQRATVLGTGGNDELVGTRRADVIVGLGGDDFISGGGGNDIICGGTGVDSISGGGGVDRVVAGKGDDLLSGDGGDDRLLGGAGFDLLFYGTSPVGVNVDLPNGISTGQGRDTLRSVEHVAGSPLADHIIGTDDFTIAFGGEGNDVIEGRGFIDFLVGEGGDDQILGGEGFDFMVFSSAPGPVGVDLSAGTATGEGNDVLAEVESLLGSPFDDTLIGDGGSNFLYGAEGNDSLDGGGGSDAALYWFATQAVTVDLSAGTATGDGSDTLTGIENLFGSEGFGDTLIGNESHNYLDGDAGNDQLSGGGGDDWIVGGPGDDHVDGGEGDYDLADFIGPAAVDANLERGTATGEGNDVLVSLEALYGTEHNDVLVGDGGINYLFGWFGDDQLSGGANNDFLDGENGADLADGGEGFDNCLNLESAPLACEGTTASPLHPLAAYSASAQSVRSFRPPRQ
ncbi:MAG TPA: calcium-binding protein [Actinomycetota bacterium]|nr:calcium-binding protein [Actinomycetota bacterium]